MDVQYIGMPLVLVPDPHMEYQDEYALYVAIVRISVIDVASISGGRGKEKN